MTVYGVLLALLPHAWRADISPSYGWGVSLEEDPRARRRFARRIHGSAPRLVLIVLVYIAGL